MKCNWPNCNKTFKILSSSWAYCSEHIMEKEKNYALYDLKYNGDNKVLVQLAHERLEKYKDFHQVDI